MERVEEVVSHVDRTLEELSSQIRAAHEQSASLAARLARLERRLGIVEAAWDKKNAPAGEGDNPTPDEPPANP